MVLSSCQSHESSPGFDECRVALSGRRPKSKQDDLGCESASKGCQKLHPPSPVIIITQPESWYSFYRPTEDRRLSRPSWLVTYRDGLPVHRRSPIRVLTGSDVARNNVDQGQRVTTKPNPPIATGLWMVKRSCKLISSSDCGPNPNTKFQWNWLAHYFCTQIEWQTNQHGRITPPCRR